MISTLLPRKLSFVSLRQVENSISDSKVEFREGGVESKAVATETRYNPKLT